MHIGGRAILNSANLEDGEAEGSRFDRVLTPRARSTARPSSACSSTSGARPATSSGRWRVAHRIHDLAVERYGLEPSDLIFDALTFPLSTGDDDLRRDAHRHDRGDPAHQGRDPGRVHGARRVERVVRPQAGGPPRAQLGVPARVRGGRARRGHRARRHDRAAATAPRRAARRSASTSSTTGAQPGYDPLHDCSRSSPTCRRTTAVKEDRSGWPVDERLKHRIIDGDRDGLDRRSRRSARRRARPRSRSSTTCCSTA